MKKPTYKTVEVNLNCALCQVCSQLRINKNIFQCKSFVLKNSVRNNICVRFRPSPQFFLQQTATNKNIVETLLKNGFLIVTPDNKLTVASKPVVNPDLIKLIKLVYEKSGKQDAEIEELLKKFQG